MLIRARTLVAAAVALAVLGGAAAALVVWLGVYDVSATRQHTGPVFVLLDYALRRSIAARADAAPPQDLTQPERVRAGAARYRQHCVQCHGAPGVAPDPFAFGLRPAPANLLHAGREWKPAELFWVVKHGIKMTGMPAWDYRLSDDAIWDVVAFVQAMPRMSPASYARLVAALPHGTALQHPESAPATRPGDAQAGQRAIAQYLCATCHVIPGFVSASNHVGPPLNGMGRRALIAGVVPNTTENMVRFLKNPQQVDPLSAMPPVGLSDQDAVDIAAYLARLDKVKH